MNVKWERELKYEQMKEETTIATKNFANEAQKL